MKETTDKKVLGEFDAASYEEWKIAAEKLLKGAPFDKKMLTQTPEGILLQPIYRREDLAKQPAAATLPGCDSYTRGSKAGGYRVAPWDIAQELPYGHPAEFNQAALSDLYRGQNALNVRLDIATLKGLDPDGAVDGEVGACGVSLASLSDWKKAFANIYPTAVALYFQSGCAGAPFMAYLQAWLEGIADVDKSKIRGSFGMDPLGVLAVAGTLPTSLDQLYDEMASIAKTNVAEMPKFTVANVSGIPYHSAGASATEELGAVLATGLAYLKALSSRGMTIDDAAKQISFTICIGADFFMELAKIRAARQLWAQIVETLGGSKEAQKMQLNGRTGFNNKTRHDPYANMLRTTTEALCGVIGGVDSLAVGAFDEIIREPDEFSRRIARNTQLILQEECELTAVVDPAGGSWYIESLTDSVARKTWEFFQKVEAAGGAFTALEDDFIQTKIAETSARKSKLVGQRRISLVGTNQYPNLNEKPLDERIPDYKALRKKRSDELMAHRMNNPQAVDIHVMELLIEIQEWANKNALEKLTVAAAKGATLSELTRALRANADAPPQIQALPNRRLASIYEELRIAASNYKQANGYGPKLYLTNLKALKRHKARADFTRSFFETGGFEVIASPGFNDASSAVEALRESGAKLTVICGADPDYEELATDFIQAIKEELPDVTVILAGYPGDKEDALKAAGMDDYIFVKSDNYATNRKYLEKLGVISAN